MFAILFSGLTGLIIVIAAMFYCSNTIKHLLSSATSIVEELSEAAVRGSTALNAQAAKLEQMSMQDAHDAIKARGLQPYASVDELLESLKSK